MWVELDLQSDVPIYEQLAGQLMEGMASGRLQPGDALPSVRSLASDLGINLHTVNKAYQTLRQEGFLQIHRKQGVVVQTQGMPGVTDSFVAKLRRQLRAVAAEAAVRGMDERRFAEECREVFRAVRGSERSGMEE
jgi:DNA-binding transcriptional regulator YhcF (GntR family)